jgi:hypothetical protein
VLSDGLGQNRRETFTMRIALPMAIMAALCFNILDTKAQGRGTKDEQEACTPDVHRLCSDAIPDEKRIVACLKLNKRKLSRACYKVFFSD